MKRQQGLSLIELMIAIVLGLFITAGMIQLFVNSNHSYRVQENLSRLQENGRFALEFISRDVRAVDYWGCVKDPTIIDNNLNSSAIFDDFAIAIEGTNDDGLNGSDSITTSGASSSAIFVVEDPTTTSSLKVTNNSGLLQSDVVIVSDCTNGDIFQITNDPGSANPDEITIATDTNSPGNARVLQRLYKIEDNVQVYKLRIVTYSILKGKGNQPALFRSVNGAANEELIEGIENMQILYGEDTNDDGSPNYYVPADEIVDMSKVVSIRISLLATTLDDNLTTEAMPYSIFGVETTPSDRKIRRVFTSTLALRNRLLN